MNETVCQTLSAAPASAAVPGSSSLSNLRTLEAEAIYILRETAAQFERARWSQPLRYRHHTLLQVLAIATSSWELHRRGPGDVQLEVNGVRLGNQISDAFVGAMLRKSISFD